MNTRDIPEQLLLFDDPAFQRGKQHNLKETLLGQIPMQQLVEIHCRIDADIETELAKFWLSYCVDRKVDASKGEQHSPQLFIRALIAGKCGDCLRQMLQYGAKIEIIGPPDMREHIQQEVQALYSMYS